MNYNFNPCIREYELPLSSRIFKCYSEGGLITSEDQVVYLRFSLSSDDIAPGGNLSTSAVWCMIMKSNRKHIMSNADVHL